MDSSPIVPAPESESDSGSPDELGYKWWRPYPFNSDGQNNRGSPENMPHPDDSQLLLLEQIFLQLTHSAQSFTQYTTVPLILNLFNNRTEQIRNFGTWVYTYDKLIDPLRENEQISFPLGVATDLTAPWTSIKTNPNRTYDVPLPRYRFVAFIFQHKDKRGQNSVTERKRMVFSLVYWDRELDELIWHDTGVNLLEQEERWRNILKWWRGVHFNDMQPGQGPRLELFGRAVGFGRPAWTRSYSRFPGTPEFHYTHHEFLQVLDGAHTNPGTKRGQAYWSMSIYPVMSWIMWLGVHTVADSPDRSQRPNLEVSPFLLATGLTMETMPTLIILIYKVLYFHRNRKQSLQQTFATQEACQAKYQINDNQTLNRALRRVIRNDFLAQLPEVPWDGLTRVYPYDPEGLN